MHDPKVDELLLQLESDPGQTISVQESPFLLGRGQDCHHTLDVRGVSRKHAQISRDEDGNWCIEDLGSTNGTFVNAQRTSDLVRVSAGDLLSIGTASLRVQGADMAIPVVGVEADDESNVTMALSAVDLTSQWTGESSSADSTQVLETTIARLRDLVDISKGLNSCDSIDTIFGKVRETVFRYLDSVERLALLVDMQGDGTLALLHSAGRNANTNTEEDWISWSICSRAYQQNMVIHTADTQDDDRFEGVESIISKGIRTAMSVPLWNDDKVVGVLYADASCPSLQDPAKTEEELGFFSALGNILAASLQRWMLSRKLFDEARMRRKLQRYHSPSVIDEIVSGTSDDHFLAPRDSDISVLFADIVGFTSMSERLSPAATARLLNGFFEEMLIEIFDNGGTLDKFIGDAIMAFFGAPQEQPDHADRTVRAALGMLSRLEQLNASGKLQEKLQIRIAINSGNAVVGDVGSTSRVDYTALGPTINLASRIEKVCPPGRCAVSQGTFSVLSNKGGWENIGPQTFKGVEHPVDVYVSK